MAFDSQLTPARPRAKAPQGSWHRRDESIMGTAVGVEVWCESPQRARDAIEAVMADMHRIDAAMSPYKPESELSRINREAFGAAVPVGPELFALLARARSYAELSEGAFDITYAAVGQLYDYRRGLRPSDAALERARAAVGYRGLALDAAAYTVRFVNEGMRIDLGGIAKGHAVECGVAILRRHGIAHGMVSAGGDSRVLGDRLGRPWMVGVRDPRRAEGLVAVLPLVDTAISTSGDYERYFEEGGRRHHHILDPRTGRSPEGVRSVTVLAQDGVCAEALSKIVFVLGWERGLEVVEQHPGADAIVVDAGGVLRSSSGMAPAALQGEST